MKKKIVISLFLLPQEISDLDNLLYTLNKSNQYLSGNYDWVIDIGMSFSSELINWNQTLIPKQFFVEKFYKLEKRTTWCETNFIIYDNLHGNTDFRRLKQYEYKDAHHVLMLDPDVVFNEKTLMYFEKAYDYLKDETEFLFITPEILQLYDDSWTEIVNDNYKDKDYNYWKNCNPFDEVGIKGDVSFEEVNFLSEIDPFRPKFRFGTGWFTSMSGSLYRLLKIPDTFAPYGPEDVYWWRTSHLLVENHGYDIKQFKIKNLVVFELNKFRNNTEYTNNMKYYHKKNEYKQITLNVMESEVSKFNKKN